MPTLETMEIVLRPRRQLTLPKKVCERLGVKPGDRLALELRGATLVAKPKRIIALEALREIREAFQRSGVTEEELIKAGKQVRQELIRKRYGIGR